MKIKNITFVSSDGINLNEHFGKGTFLWKYEISGSEMQFIGKEKIDKEETKMMHEQMETVLLALQGADVVVAQKIGQGVKRILAENEIYPLEYDGRIDDAIVKLLRYLFRE